MRNRLLIVCVLLVAAICLAGRFQPARAASSDQVVIKNELDYGTVYYGVVKSFGWHTGCLAHRLQFSDSYLIKPIRVEFRIYRTHADCGSSRNVLYKASMQYWAPKTTYLITGSPDLKNFRITETH